MPVTNVPAFPLRSSGLTQEAYSSQVEASLSAIPTAITDLNAVGSAYALATNATSTTSNTIGTGSKSFTTQTNLGYQVGQSLRIANTSTNFMTGEVTSYNTGTGALVINISSVSGSGTFTSWFLSQSATGASSATAVSFTPAGTIAATNVQSAIQELDTEKLSSAAGAVTGTNLEDIVTGSSVGSITAIPQITFDANGRITAATTTVNYPIRAWGVFNGTGTPTWVVNGNFNATITDNGVGDYSVTFVTALPDANYAISGSVNGPAGDGYIANISAKTSAGFRFNTRTSAALGDSTIVSLMVVR